MSGPRLFSEYGPLYQEGMVTLDNANLLGEFDLTRCQFGVQVADDGRVWVCINGASVLRFKPRPGEVLEGEMLEDRDPRIDYGPQFGEEDD